MYLAEWSSIIEEKATQQSLIVPGSWYIASVFKLWPKPDKENKRLNPGKVTNI
jgi:hypothetical protein